MDFYLKMALEYTDKAFYESLKGFVRSTKKENEHHRMPFWRDRVVFFTGELNKIDREILNFEADATPPP